MPYLKMLWQTESPTPQIGSWDFWKSVSGTLFNIDGIPLVKINNKIAYYGYYKVWDYDSGDLLIPIIISPDEEAVYTSYNGSTFNRSDGSVTDANGITWYYSICGGNIEGSSADKNCQVPELEPWGTPPEDATNTMLDLIYAVPFRQAYNVGTPYVLGRTNKQRTIRKMIGLHLMMNFRAYTSNPRLGYLSDHADNVISEALTSIGSDDSIQMRIINNRSAITFEIDHFMMNATQVSPRYNKITDEAGLDYQLCGFYKKTHTRDTILISSSTISKSTQTVTDLPYGVAGSYSSYVYVGILSAWADVFGFSTEILATNLGIDL